MKILAGHDSETLEGVTGVCERIISAGVHRAPSIQVAEAAKVIENTQRDLNIALINELAPIFDRLGLCTSDTLAAARTEWSSLAFSPGLVGGHCIGVDPHYLTTRAQQLGYHPDVILAGRRINDGMGAFIAQTTVELLLANDVNPATATVNVLGSAFEEGVGDLRNSRVPDIVDELQSFGVRVVVADPRVDVSQAQEEFDLTLVPLQRLIAAEATVLAVAHPEFLESHTLTRLLAPGSVVVDVKSLLDPSSWPELRYWPL